MSRRRPRSDRLIQATLLAALTLVTARAQAACSTRRPTTPSANWAYEAGAELASYAPADGAFRVWYARTGADAVAGVSTDAGDAGAPAVPDSVQLAATIAQEARRYFAESLGFALPAPESPSADCDDASTDGLIDIYLVDFAGSSDGTVGYDACPATTLDVDCPGFIVVENDFRGGGYPDLETALRTVLPHEYFHLVQGSYSHAMDDWWAEGTAQWAADSLHPELTDLEAYLPAYLSDVGRPLDLPPATAAQPFSYGAAIFPVFLAEAFEPGVVRETFLAQRQDADEWSALDQTLAATGTSLGDAFGLFARWNAATGGRADRAAGYQNGVDYPQVELRPFDATVGAVVSGATAGLSAHYYAVATNETRSLSLDADAKKTQAWILPLVNGHVALGEARALPTHQLGDSILVVAGIAPEKADAAYRITVSQSASAEPVGTARAEDSEDAGPSSEQAIATEGGCSVLQGTSRTDIRDGWLAMLVLAALLCRGRP